MRAGRKALLPALTNLSALTNLLVPTNLSALMKSDLFCPDYAFSVLMIVVSLEVWNTRSSTEVPALSMAFVISSAS